MGLNYALPWSSLVMNMCFSVLHLEQLGGGEEGDVWAVEKQGQTDDFTFPQKTR